ncbi:hypothetical protein DFJ58DRAFT_670975 [Suillus subalutaceus]|uniref:uncharacterized protein n=1 Tax=Suillus subalutaceus TaxID=48586 RepID=UPI001B8811E1|nr:uncharacterized protein DFJ58DRAFT_670975 [Suillus subalutaceus]KAG1833196.1 hypothetical protein DFJ58DRAFT_670975 [Suillus subalutaceus]
MKGSAERQELIHEGDSVESQNGVNHIIYDVRRGQDVINPWTSHCNVMVLRSDNDMGPQGHRFTYGKVLGIYHINVIVIGVGMVDYTPLHMEFLWIRWYQPVQQLSTWDTSTLDRVRFPPLDDEYSFDFLDPSDILHGCHIIPSLPVAGNISMD